MPITIQHVKVNTIADYAGTVTVGNSSGGTAQVSATDLVRPSDWNSVHASTLSLTGAEVASLFNFGSGLTSTTNAGGVTVGVKNAMFFEPYPLLATTSLAVTTANIIGTWYFEPVQLPDGLLPGYINIFRSANSSHFRAGVTITYTDTANWQRTGSYWDIIAFYTYDTANTRLVSIWSGQNALSATLNGTISSTGANSTNVGITQNLTVGFVTQVNTAGASTSSAYTLSGTTNQSASSMAAASQDPSIWSSANSSAMNFFTGLLAVPIPFNTTLTPGQYWLGHAFTTSSSGAVTGRNMNSAQTMFNSLQSYLYINEPLLTGFKRLGVSTIGNSSSNAIMWHGADTNAGSSSPKSTIGTTNLSATTGHLYWNYVQDQLG